MPQKIEWRPPARYRKALEKVAGYILFSKLDREMGLDGEANRLKAIDAMRVIKGDWDTKYIEEMLGILLEERK